MKKLFNLLLVFSIASLQSQNTQSSCVTAEHSNNRSSSNITFNELHHPTYQISDLSYNINVRIHKVTNTNESAGVIGTSTNSINAIIDNLNIYTNNEITFNWDQTFQTANSDDLENSEIEVDPTNGSSSYDFSFTDPFVCPTAIDIFLFNKNLGASAAKNIGDGTRIIISNNMINSKVFAHEIGHVLGLFHTFHGTYGNGSDSSENNDGDHSNLVECAGSISNDKGDFVSDTAPDAGLLPAENGCNAGTGETLTYNCDGDNFTPYPLIPEWDNFMRANRSNAGNYNVGIACMENFTLGQISRMKSFISEFDHLTALTEEPCCELEIADLDELGDFITINEPAPFGNPCNRNFENSLFQSFCSDWTYQWKVFDNVISTNGNTASHVFAPGEVDVPITLTIMDQEENEYSLTVLVDSPCNQNDIPDCEATIDAIINSAVYNHPSCAGISSFELTVPLGSTSFYNITLTDLDENNSITLIDGEQLIPYPNLYISYKITLTNLIPTGFKCSKKGQNRPCQKQLIERKIVLHPNPFSNEIFVENSQDRPISKVEIYNSYGTRITSQPYSEGIPIRIERGAPGLYFAKVYFEDGIIETIELIKK